MHPAVLPRFRGVDDGMRTQGGLSYSYDLHFQVPTAHSGRGTRGWGRLDGVDQVLEIRCDACLPDIMAHDECCAGLLRSGVPVTLAHRVEQHTCSGTPISMRFASG
jgi:hypothetical protein